MSESTRGAGNSGQGLAPRSKPAAAKAAQIGFGYRKRRWDSGASPPVILRRGRNLFSLKIRLFYGNGYWLETEASVFLYSGRYILLIL